METDDGCPVLNAPHENGPWTRDRRISGQELRFKLAQVLMETESVTVREPKKSGREVRGEKIIVEYTAMTERAF